MSISFFINLPMQFHLGATRWQERRAEVKPLAVLYCNQASVTESLWFSYLVARSCGAFKRTMKPQVTAAEMRPPATKPTGAEAALSLQDELIAAIHGAFEVAVEIAVREVTKLVGQATGGVYGEMRRENESLKQRLQRAEAMLNFARREDRGGSWSPSAKQLLDATNHRDRSPRFKYSQKNPNTEAAIDHGGTGVRGQHAPTSSTHQPTDHRERRSALNSEKNNGCAVACDALTTGVSEEMSHVCVVRVESLNQSCQDLAAQGHDSPPLPSAQDRPALEEVTVKQEKTEEEADGSACCLDSIKVEDFSHECMSEVQSKLLEEWKPETLDIQSQDSSTRLSCSGIDEEFPNILQLPEPASIPDAPSQIYGVHVRSGRSVGQTFTNLYACKSCGQTFHLPSLLRRHHGQCQQKLQQRCQQPVVGNRRTRLQLYPPGCSPFRCTVCNREFNRMENLKTHLRIHTGERPYTCSVCSKCFRHSGALTRHFRIHTGEKPYICGQCGKSFRNCGGLKFHQRSHSKQLQ